MHLPGGRDAMGTTRGCGPSRGPEASRSGVLLVAALLITVGCGTDDGVTSPPPPAILASAVADNPSNVLSAVVTGRVRHADSVAVRYGLAGSPLDSATPAVTLAGDSVLVPVLGLLPDSRYILRLVAYGGDQTVLGDPVGFATGRRPPAPLPRSDRRAGRRVLDHVRRDADHGSLRAGRRRERAGDGHRRPARQLGGRAVVPVESVRPLRDHRLGPGEPNRAERQLDARQLAGPRQRRQPDRLVPEPERDHQDRHANRRGAVAHGRPQEPVRLPGRRGPGLLVSARRSADGAGAPPAARQPR